MVTLLKGQTVSLKKEAPNVKKIILGVGWDPTGKAVDVDVGVYIICTDIKGKIEDIISSSELTPFYSIKFCGENFTGDGEGYDQQIKIKLHNVPKRIQRISIILKIFAARIKKQDFSRVEKCYIHVMDIDSGCKLVSYEANDDYRGKKGIIVADLMRDNEGGWIFEAIGEGTNVNTFAQMVKVEK